MTTPQRLPLADAPDSRAYWRRLAEGAESLIRERDARIAALEAEVSNWKAATNNLLMGHPELIPVWNRISEAHDIER